MQRIGFLGPSGTFSEKALRSRPEAATAQLVPYRAVDVALQALRDGEIDGAVVPIENSVEGGVPATLDALVSGTPLVVVGEIVVPVSFVLAVRPGVTAADVKSVGTHPHAWAQIRGWVGENLHDAAFVPTTSTAASAVDLARRDDDGQLIDLPYEATACLDIAAIDNGLTILASDIGDNKEAVTRFVLVSRPGRLPEPTGRDKTTLTLFQEHDRPGALLELLEQFKTRGINLTRLESRPTGESLGRYCFSVDLEGHVLEERVGEALAGLKRICLDVRFLGSYPRADDVAGQVPDGFDDYAYQSAARWLLAVRGGRSPIRAIN
ncbi:MAG: prephenate dehydratase [Dermatophilus congolensis]|nr:prephenate dehydratase [Dermatophilus congolensis]